MRPGVNDNSQARVALWVLLAVACLQLTVCSDDTGASQPFVSPDVVARGAGLYATKCQECHGDRHGEGSIGGAPPHNETGHTWHHPDTQVADWILNGKPVALGSTPMPGFKDELTVRDVDATLAYIKTWWTEEQRESQADVSRKYQEALDKRKGQ